MRFVILIFTDSQRAAAARASEVETSERFKTGARPAPRVSKVFIRKKKKDISGGAILATTGISKHTKKEKANKLYKKAQRRIAKGFAGISGAFIVQKMYTFDKKAEKRLDKKSEKRMIPVLYYLRTAT